MIVGWSFLFEPIRMKRRYKGMSDKMRYRIVYARNYEKALEDQVNKLIKQGWVPQGVCL
jgi:hypothetical protein